jgi:predicted Fe-S protein YdhL (DUF1289 family)
MDSPCIGQCRFLDFGDDEYVCEVCKRTLEQITNWSKMNDEERKQIMDQLNAENIRRV